MVGHVSVPAAAVLAELPTWVALIRADNPGPMTLDGTNSWVLRTDPSGPCLVVDPGPDDDAHLAALAAHGPVAGILVTHGHPDHVEGVATLVRRLGGDVPVLAAHTGGNELARNLGAATGLDLGMRAVPGHTADSVCFVAGNGAQTVVLTGDTILGRGTTIVAHPDGNLGDYLASLETLTTCTAPALPGHGPALADCGAAARFYLAHRRARLDEVRAAVAAGARTPEEVVAVVYRDVPAALWPAAAWSVRAQLAYLGQEDRQETDRRESAPPRDSLEAP